MGTAVIAALAALAGVTLGRILDVWAESKKGLRGHRAVAYAAFLGSAERYLSGVLVAEGLAEFRSSEQGRELDRTYGDLQVFSSELVHRLARDARAKLFHIHSLRRQQTDSETAGKSFDDLAKAAIGDCQTAIDLLRSAMKRDLKVR